MLHGIYGSLSGSVGMEWLAIAAGIAAALFIISAIVLRSFRDVSHRGERHDVHGNA